MTKLVQISVLLTTILLGEVNSVTIFQGLSIKKGIDISLIPFPIKPIAFIKEKWTPFGSFGMKHEIAKREDINIKEPEVIVTPVPVPAYVVPEVPRPAILPVAPVVEHHDEEIIHEKVEQEIPLVTPSAAPVVENIVSETPIVPVEEPAPIVHKEVIVVPTEAPPVLITPVPPIPIQAPPIVLVPTPIPNNLNTDISRVPSINNYLNSVEKSVPVIVPPVQEVKETPPPSLFSGFLQRDGLRNGSKLAIQLGSAFLHFMTQVFNNPRTPFA
ncbi:repetitive proline-rich cell wall protein 2 [Manduca sexta]|nr:repetitive proline-rich cell wall protein 2 [Manduca sexta]